MHSAGPARLMQTRGKYEVKYGQQIDDWSALFLSETDEHFQNLETRVQQSIMAIDRAASGLKNLKQPLQFQDSRQALFYGLGVSLPYSITGIVLLVLYFVLIRDGQLYQERQKILDQYQNAPAYRQIMEQGRIIEDRGVLYLQLEPLPKKGEIQIGKHYIYDPQGRHVLVPLGNR